MENKNFVHFPWIDTKSFHFEHLCLIIICIDYLFISTYTCVVQKQQNHHHSKICRSQISDTVSTHASFFLILGSICDGSILLYIPSNLFCQESSMHTPMSVWFILP